MSTQTDAFGYLTNCLTKWEDSGQVGLAAWRLQYFGPGAEPAIPLLLQALNTTNFSAWKTVLDSLACPGSRRGIFNAKAPGKIDGGGRCISRKGR